MKYLTQEMKDSSVYKWNMFIACCKDKIVKNYREEYWKQCSICDGAHTEYMLIEDKKPSDSPCMYCDLAGRACGMTLSKAGLVLRAINFADLRWFLFARWYGQRILKKIKKIPIG